MNESDGSEPRGSIAIRQPAMPANLNAGGNIFGGWLLSQMDLAGGTCASERARGRVATVAITAMEFHQPVFVGDVLTCYTQLTHVGNTSLTVHVQAWVHRRSGEDTQELKVTAGDFVFVALDDAGNKRKVPD